MLLAATDYHDRMLMAHPVVLVIIALAAYRLTAVLTGIDSLLEGFHRWLPGVAYEQDDCGGVLEDDCGDQVRKPGTTLFHTKVIDLLTCPFCLGFHVCWVMLCLWIAEWPWDLGVAGWITALALAGVQAFLTAIDGR